jgi:uncharacterized membrane protein
MTNKLYIFATIFFTVYGQLVIKWRVSQAGALPKSTTERVAFVLQLIINPWMLSALGGAVLASLFWMAALRKFELSYAYPFMSLSFILVFLLSIPIFHETFSVGKCLGLLLITSGIVVMSRI